MCFRKIIEAQKRWAAQSLNAVPVLDPTGVLNIGFAVRSQVGVISSTPPQRSMPYLLTALIRCTDFVTLNGETDRW